MDVRKLTKDFDKGIDSFIDKYFEIQQGNDFGLLMGWVRKYENKFNNLNDTERGWLFQNLANDVLNKRFSSNLSKININDEEEQINAIEKSTKEAINIEEVRARAKKNNEKSWGERVGVEQTQQKLYKAMPKFLAANGATKIEDLAPKGDLGGAYSFSGNYKGNDFEIKITTLGKAFWNFKNSKEGSDITNSVLSYIKKNPNALVKETPESPKMAFDTDDPEEASTPDVAPEISSSTKAASSSAMPPKPNEDKLRGIESIKGYLDRRLSENSTNQKLAVVKARREEFDKFLKKKSDEGMTDAQMKIFLDDLFNEEK